jgi:hypothetical protein
MIRCTIEMLPGGDETRKRTIGLVEIANVGGDRLIGDYQVVLTKTPPFKGALRERWRAGKFVDDEEAIVAKVEGFDRVKRGSYDLLFRALSACGLGARNA